MTIDEFKAWFEGFTECRDHLTADELGKVKEKLSELSSAPKFPVMRPAGPRGPMKLVGPNEHVEIEPRCLYEPEKSPKSEALS